MQADRGPSLPCCTAHRCKLKQRALVSRVPNVRAKATAEADADWPRKDDTHWTWSGQAVAAVAGRRLERGVSLQCATALTQQAQEDETLRLAAPLEGASTNWPAYPRTRVPAYLRAEPGAAFALVVVLTRDRVMRAAVEPRKGAG